MSVSNIVFLLVYMSPSIVGWFKKAPNWWQLLFINIFTSWTILGWFLSWGLVFPWLLGWFRNWVAEMHARNPGYLTNGSGMPMGGGGGFGTDQGSGTHVCPTCNGARQVMCTTCHGRGSWYTQPQTANEIAQLQTCGACAASGKITCPGCGGSGRSM